MAASVPVLVLFDEADAARFLRECRERHAWPDRLRRAAVLLLAAQTAAVVEDLGGSDGQPPELGPEGRLLLEAYAAALPEILATLPTEAMPPEVHAFAAALAGSDLGLSPELQALAAAAEEAVLQAIRADLPAAADSLEEHHRQADALATRPMIGGRKSGLARGWVPLVTWAVDLLEAEVPEACTGEMVARDLGEKWGSLRWTAQGGTLPEMEVVVDLVEWVSGRTCQACGRPGRRRTEGRHWVLTLCDEHAGEAMATLKQKMYP